MKGSRTAVPNNTPGVRVSLVTRPLNGECIRKRHSLQKESHEGPEPVRCQKDSIHVEADVPNPKNARFYTVATVLLPCLEAA